MNPLWDNLVSAIRKLPGVGPKMAERMALFLLRSSDTDQLVKAIQEAKERLKKCGLCGIYSEKDICLRCSDPSRDHQLLCVVEEMADMMSLERSGVFHGHYHLLGGVLAPLDGIGPKDLRVKALMDRLEKDDPRVEEIILATNPTVEGEATATYLSQLIQPFHKKITRLAYGLPSGASLEYADELTVSRAFEGRQEMA